MSGDASRCRTCNADYEADALTTQPSQSAKRMSKQIGNRNHLLRHVMQTTYRLQIPKILPAFASD